MSRYSAGGPSLLEGFKKKLAVRKSLGATPSRLLEPVSIVAKKAERAPRCGCGKPLNRCDGCGQFYCVAPGHASHVCAGGAA